MFFTGADEGCSMAGSHRSTGPESVRRHRSQEFCLISILLVLCVESIFAFRGPHHPKSTVSHHHHHYVPKQSSKLIQDEELLHDASHIAEDIGPLAEQIDVSKMSAQEREFYYFKVHDFDNNTKLDGLELFHALQHIYHTDDEHETNELSEEYAEDKENPYLDDSGIVDLIDRVLEKNDLDNDGYLGYIEYVLARQKNDETDEPDNVKLKI